MVCVPTPATDGSKIPAVASTIPTPENIPPDGFAAKVCVPSSVQKVLLDLS